jgi:hypothetical protein
MDSETKQILASICEILKAEIVRATSVDTAMVALARTIVQADPKVRQNYDDQYTKALSIPGVADPQNSDSLARLSELIRRLKE